MKSPISVYDVGEGEKVTLRSERSGADLRTLWAYLDTEGNLYGKSAAE
jgi:hypothetical protein